MPNTYIPVQVDAKVARLLRCDIQDLVDDAGAIRACLAEEGNGDMWENSQNEYAIQHLWDIHHILVSYN